MELIRQLLYFALSHGNTKEDEPTSFFRNFACFAVSWATSVPGSCSSVSHLPKATATNKDRCPDSPTTLYLPTNPTGIDSPTSFARSTSRHQPSCWLRPTSCTTKSEREALKVKEAKCRFHDTIRSHPHHAHAHAHYNLLVVPPHLVRRKRNGSQRSY